MLIPTTILIRKLLKAAGIPLVLAGKDVCGSAITGSGKTAAYGLPLLERLLYRPAHVAATYALILVPTRELAVQVHSMLTKLAQTQKGVRIALVVGGLSQQVQATNLRARPEIVVATPNRMIDHLTNTHSVSLEDLSTLVLDEADRLLDLGFADQVKEILRHCPVRRQTLLFSATMTSGVQQLMDLSLRDPVRIAADPKHATPSLLTQEIVLLKGPLASKKEAILLHLCTKFFKEKTVIFSRTKQYAHRLKLIFGLSRLRASELHGNMSQAQRLQALEDFRSGEAKYLIATDVASRGLDILGVETVISFDPPDTLTTHIHRIGRTARAGKAGRSIALLDPKEDRALLKQMAKHAGSAAKLKQRIVPTDKVDAHSEAIAALAVDIARVLREEKDERMLQKAEMEVTRATNLVEYSDDIKSRPAKSWFQTERRKRQLQVASREEMEQEKSNGHRPAAKSKDKKKKAVQQSELWKAEQKNKQEKQQKHMAKAAKSQERRLRGKGFTPKQAFETASQADRKKRKPSQSESPAKRKKEEPAFKPKLRPEQKRELAKRKRGGKTVKAFKSKKKYKRR